MTHQMMCAHESHHKKNQFQVSGKLRDADVNKSYSSHFLLIFPNYNQTKKIRTRSREMRKEEKEKARLQ